MPKLKRALIKWAPIGQEPDQCLAEKMVGMLLADGCIKQQPVTAIRHAMRMAGFYTTKDEHKRGHKYRADNARMDLFVLMQHPDFDARDMLALFDLVLGMVAVPIDESVFEPVYISRGRRDATNLDMGEVEPDNL